MHHVPIGFVLSVPIRLAHRVPIGQVLCTCIVYPQDWSFVHTQCPYLIGPFSPHWSCPLNMHCVTYWIGPFHMHRVPIRFILYTCNVYLQDWCILHAMCPRQDSSLCMLCVPVRLDRSFLEALCPHWSCPLIMHCVRNRIGHFLMHPQDCTSYWIGPF